jgi:Fe(3+) dicitrate transport protein
MPFSKLLSGILLLVLLTITAASAQVATLSGLVSSADNEEALAGATVLLANTPFLTETNAQGKFRLEVPYGNYVLQVFYEGLSTYKKQIVINAPEINLNIGLNPLEEVLNAVEVTGSTQAEGGLQHLNAVEGTAIYEAKKSEVITLNSITANLATNNSRQVYAKVPGLNIWESDGAGLQLGIGGRGLSPDRTSNFNTRQNGYDISPDALGYPESYYTPPLEAVEKIQLVRGAASLQYGPQFGGMLNFVMKKGPENDPFELTARQTLGSFGLSNSFVSVGGTKERVNYYNYLQYKRGNGWRPNSEFESKSAFFDLNMQLTDKFFLCLEYTHTDYLAQQPGGLTDAQFAQDPRRSFRSRNWFAIDWNLMAVLMEYKFSPRTKVEAKNFALIAERQALGDLDPIDRPVGETRKLFDDDYRTLGSEVRLLHNYTLGQQPAVVVVGGRAYRGQTLKRQSEAPGGSEANFSFLNSDSLRVNHTFPNTNFSFFAENIFNLTDKLSVVPGFRYEWINTEVEGQYLATKDTVINGVFTEKPVFIGDTLNSSRSVLLGGLGISYRINNYFEAYSNFSRNYRPINFSDLRTINPNEKPDPTITDETGFNWDVGFRGGNRRFSIDASLFYLSYQNRIGWTLTKNANGSVARQRTNIGDAAIVGLEAVAETDLLQWFRAKPKNALEAYLNLGLTRGRYTRLNQEVDGQSSISNLKIGNAVELIPEVNLKTGLQYRSEAFKIAYQFAYLSQQYTDALNTFVEPGTPPSATAGSVFGQIPAYWVMDLSSSYTWQWLTLEGGVNNLTNNMYFTRRASAYPGPGIIPADGRNLYVSLQVKL